MNGQQVTATSASHALRSRYPDDDVKAQCEPGGVRASVSGRDGGMYVSVGDQPGILSAWLGLEGPGAPHGDGARNWTPRQAS